MNAVGVCDGLSVEDVTTIVSKSLHGTGIKENPAWQLIESECHGQLHSLLGKVVRSTRYAEQNCLHEMVHQASQALSYRIKHTIGTVG